MQPGQGPSKEQQHIDPKLVQALYVINKLGHKVAEAKTLESLMFTIVNDTIILGRYDRALLWSLESAKPELLSVSGQAKFPKTAKIVKKWELALNSFEDLSKPQVKVLDTKKGDVEQEGTRKSTIIWLPIFVDEKATLGLWLELWHQPTEQELSPTGMVRLLSELLLPAYGAAWGRLSKNYRLNQLKPSKQTLFYGIITILVLLFAVRVPLRVVAPAEVVPKDPIVVTAPLEGIIGQVLVAPGQFVDEGDLLFEYDKDVPLQRLEVAKKNIEVLQSELNRASSLGLNDPSQRSQYAILERKLDREKTNLDFAQWQASQLQVPSPENGYAMVDNPDQWRGKPVQVGEKVLTVNNPNRTKVRMWIPEADNIPLNPESPVKVILNIDPLHSYDGTLTFISYESQIYGTSVLSFMAEADWEQPQDAKLGLKGTAFLYGENVSLFYFLFRKPIRYVRNFIGI